MASINIPFNDYLHCESYYSMCDYPFKDKGQDLPTGIINCDIQGVKDLLERIKDFPDRKYIIVSSRSDYGLAFQAEHHAFKDLVRWVELMTDPSIGYQDIEVKARVKRENCNLTDKYSVRSHYMTSHTFNEIPPNVVKWFNTNLHIRNDSKLECIPFGLNCTDGKTSGLEGIYKHKYSGPRDKLLYVNFSLNTFERAKIKAFYSVYGFPTIKENLGQEEYLDDLASHKFCLCPPGVGLDSYRVYECLYMGCIPIVETNELTVSLGNLGLPLMSMHTLLALNPNDLEAIYIGFQKNIHKFNYEPLKASYWRKRIEDSRSLL